MGLSVGLTPTPTCSHRLVHPPPQAALESGQLSVVLNPNFVVITQIAFSTNLTLAPLHYVLYDRLVPSHP